jgi:hypothetical protein
MGKREMYPKKKKIMEKQINGLLPFIILLETISKVG